MSGDGSGHRKEEKADQEDQDGCEAVKTASRHRAALVVDWLAERHYSIPACEGQPEPEATDPDSEPYLPPGYSLIPSPMGQDSIKNTCLVMLRTIMGPCETSGGM